jgi:hypothetical protein
MDLSKAENLVCFGCNTKHPRERFMDFATKLENFLPTNTPETRLCLHRRDLLFEWADHAASKRETLRHVKGILRSPGTRKCHVVMEYISFCIHCRDEVMEGKCLCDEMLFRDDQSLEKRVFRCRYCPRMVRMPRYVCVLLSSSFCDLDQSTCFSIFLQCLTPYETMKRE